MVTAANWYATNVHNRAVNFFPNYLGSHALKISKRNDDCATAIAKAAVPVVLIAGAAVATGLLGKIKFANAVATYAARIVAPIAAWAVSLPVIGVVTTLAQKAFYGTIGHDQRTTKENIARLALPVIAGVVTFFFAPAKLVALIPVKPLLARIGLGAVAAAVISAVANKLFNNCVDAAAKKAKEDKEAVQKEAADKTAKPEVTAVATAAKDAKTGKTEDRSSIELGAAPKADKSSMSPEQLAAEKAKNEAAAKQKDQDTLKAAGRLDKANKALIDAQKKFDADKATFDSTSKTGGPSNDVKTAFETATTKLAEAKKEVADAEVDVKKTSAATAAAV